MKKRANNKGFTMVELIIVIAIIAVLSAVLAPQYLKYVERTKEVSDIQIATNIVKAATLAIADPSNNIPAGHYIEILWITGGESGSYAKSGQIMIRIRSLSNTRISVFNEAGGIYNLPPLPDSFDLKPYATTIINILGAENQSMQYGIEHIADMDDGKSELANDGNLAFHINTTTGEVALAKLTTASNSTAIANKWVELGLNVIPAP